MTLSEIGLEEATRRTPSLSMSQLWSIFHKDMSVGLKEMGTDQERQILCSTIAIELYCQRDERPYHKSGMVFKDSKAPTGYVNRASYIHNVKEN